MTVICVPCMLDGHRVEASDLINGTTSCCLDHAANAMRYCAMCRYWVATVGPLCEACAAS